MRGEQRLPRVDRARHGHAVGGGVVDRGDALLFVPVDGGGRGRAARAVQRDHLAGRRPAHRGRSNHRRCRWIAARSRTARRRRPPPRPARCRRRAAHRARSAWRPAWRSRPCRASRRPGCGRESGNRACVPGLWPVIVLGSMVRRCASKPAPSTRPGRKQPMPWNRSLMPISNGWTSAWAPSSTRSRSRGAQAGRETHHRFRAGDRGETILGPDHRPLPLRSVDRPAGLRRGELPAAADRAFISEVLTLGMPDEDGAVVLIKPDFKVPNGGRLF